uniref:Uncharacterized protein n=1 Tax=Physcomitrium patens TaxID=3218 RepID=A0A2K1IZ83_PHYPA|nr:hypothetical protein PHYPA_024411 [Physcomitrium patens]
MRGTGCMRRWMDGRGAGRARVHPSIERWVGRAGRYAEPMIGRTRIKKGRGREDC